MPFLRHASTQKENNLIAIIAAILFNSMHGSTGTAGIGCIVGEYARGVAEILCKRLLRPDLLIHLFQQVLAHKFLKLPFVHKLSRDLLVLVHPVDKEPFESF